MVLTERNSFMVHQCKECLDYFLMLIRVSRANGKDMFDCFSNIYADIVLADCKGGGTGGARGAIAPPLFTDHLKIINYSDTQNSS